MLLNKLADNKTLKSILLLAWAVSISYGIYANYLSIREYHKLKENQDVE